MLGDSGGNSKDNNDVFMLLKLLENCIRILVACRKIKINKFIILINERVGNMRANYFLMSLRN